MKTVDILFEDEDLIAIQKPAGLPSQGTLDPKRPHAVSVLKLVRPQSTIFLHHRLDKDTSGVLLLSKSTRINAALTDIFRNHNIQKTYLALVLNKQKIPPTEFTIENHLAPVRGQEKKLMRMVEVKKGGWLANTSFRTLEIFSDYSLIEASPKTGRTHQIRVHLAGLKFPIAGDFLYGGKSSFVPRLMLHAQKLEFTHPLTKKSISIEAPLPNDFHSILGKLRAK